MLNKNIFRRQATLTLITVDEDETRIAIGSKFEPAVKRRVSPPPPSYEEIIMEDTNSIQSESFSIETVLDQSQNDKDKEPCNQDDDSSQRVMKVTRFCSFFGKRPVLKLFSIIIINGFVSMAFAAIFIQVKVFFIKPKYVSCKNVLNLA